METKEQILFDEAVNILYDTYTWDYGTYTYQYDDRDWLANQKQESRKKKINYILESIEDEQ